jgi:hypothetical protein
LSQTIKIIALCPARDDVIGEGPGLFAELEQYQRLTSEILIIQRHEVERIEKNHASSSCLSELILLRPQ